MSCTFNEDNYRDQQLNKHLEGDISELSNCCHEEIDNRGLCSYCYEHCITVAEEHEAMLDDIADMKHEEAKEKEWEDE